MAIIGLSSLVLVSMFIIIIVVIKIIEGFRYNKVMEFWKSDIENDIIEFKYKFPSDEDFKMHIDKSIENYNKHCLFNSEKLI